MKADLERRLVALETRNAAPLNAWCVFIVPMGVKDEAIIGYQHNEGVVMREPGESLGSLKTRTQQSVDLSALVVLQPLVESRDQISTGSAQ